MISIATRPLSPPPPSQRYGDLTLHPSEPPLPPSYPPTTSTSYPPPPTTTTSYYPPTIPIGDYRYTAPQPHYAAYPPPPSHPTYAYPYTVNGGAYTYTNAAAPGAHAYTGGSYVTNPGSYLSGATASYGTPALYGPGVPAATAVQWQPLYQGPPSVNVPKSGGVAGTGKEAEKKDGGGE